MHRIAFDPQPIVLAGESVRIEPMTMEHARDLTESGADPSIWTWLSRGPFESMADTLAWIDEAQTPSETQGRQLPFTIIERSTDTAVGSTRFLNIEVPNRSLEIGWTWLTPRVHRSPVNTECKWLLLHHAFETLGAVRVQLKTDERNEHSRRAIERIGAKLEGILRNHMIQPGGRLRNSAMYSITQLEWPDVKQRLAERMSR